MPSICTIAQFRARAVFKQSLDEWGKLDRLATYPSLECPSGDGGDNEKMYYVAVAKSIIGRDLEEALDLLALVSAGRNTKFTVLAGLEAAFLQQDAGLIQSRFHEYLSYFAKKVLLTRSIERVSCEATFYFYRASRIGVSLTVERVYSDFVMKLSEA